MPLALVVRQASAAGKRPPRLSSSTMDALLRWSWPGNVRELSNALERAVLLGGDPVEPCDLPEEMLSTTASSSAKAEKLDDLLDLPYVDAVAAARRLIVVEALRRSGGHQTRAAEALGVTQPYLSRLMKNLGAR